MAFPRGFCTPGAQVVPLAGGMLTGVIAPSAGPHHSAPSADASSGCWPPLPLRVSLLPLFLRGDQGSSSNCSHLLMAPAPLATPAGAGPNLSTLLADASRACAISAWEQRQWQGWGCQQMGPGAMVGGNRQGTEDGPTPVLVPTATSQPTVPFKLHKFVH